MTKEQALSDPAASLADFADLALADPIVVERATPAARATMRAMAMTQFEAHRPLVTQVIQFGTVGTVGFMVDSGFVYTAHFVFGLGLILAGILSFFVAGSGNWFLNRVWTFRGASRGRMHYEWLRYLASNAAGFVLNRGTYVALIATSTLCNLHPVLALAAGSLSGLGVNFMMSRRVVFR
jgi:putative flippase GtrA